MTNSYLTLRDFCYTRIAPTPVKAPQLVLLNAPLAREVGLELPADNPESLAAVFSGNALPDGAQPIALAYAGHQFGHLAMLGDGRAHLLGEQRSPSGQLIDIQLKGSGQTPYGLRGDGRAALGPMLREYLISEAMHALGIATTRSLAVVTTGEPVFRQTMLQGAIVTRTASSHLRVGSFEYVAAQHDEAALRQLADFAIARHTPELSDAESPYLAFLQTVIDRQIALVCDWLRVGFIHGVMNTDNMTISGETIDYGPCAFMDAYDPQTVFSSIDHQGRYAFANQPQIAGWNLARLAEAMLPLLGKTLEEGFANAETMLDSYNTRFQSAWLAMMRRKLGLRDEAEQDARLIGDLLKWMQRNGADFTQTFRRLNDAECSAMDAEWLAQWQARSPDTAIMNAANPAVIPRNHRVEEALNAAEEDGDLEPFKTLLTRLQSPYETRAEEAEQLGPPPLGNVQYQTFCGT